MLSYYLPGHCSTLLPLVVLACPLVVLACPLVVSVCLLVVLKVLSVSLFITDIEFITVIDKIEEVKKILRLGSSNTENYNNNGFSFYLQENNLILT